jgi:hypothetical protein
MTERTVVHWIDDLDGSEAQETVAFGLDRIGYELDLSQENAAALREELAVYIAHARRQARSTRRGGARSRGPTAGARRGPGTTRSPDQSAAIREWARRHGYTVADRGRIPREVTEAYSRDAGATTTTSTPTTAATAPAAAADSTGDPAPNADASAPVGLDGLTVEEREHIRGWAQQQGIEVKPRGRLSRDLIANYRATATRLGA